MSLHFILIIHFLCTAPLSAQYNLLCTALLPLPRPSFFPNIVLPSTPSPALTPSASLLDLPPFLPPPPATSSGDSPLTCVSQETRARYRPLPSFPLTLPLPLFPFRSTSDTSMPLLITAGPFPLRLSIPRASLRGPPPFPTHTPSRTHRPSNAREQRPPRPPPRPSGAASASISRCRLPTRRGRRN